MRVRTRVCIRVSLQVCTRVCIRVSIRVCRKDCIRVCIWVCIRVCIVIVIVKTTYHAIYWSYRASRTDRWFLPCLIPWVPGLPEVAHGMTEDPEDRGSPPTRLWGQWELQSFSISNGGERWPVESLGVRGQGMATQ